MTFYSFYLSRAAAERRVSKFVAAYAQQLRNRAPIHLPDETQLAAMPAHLRAAILWDLEFPDDPGRDRRIRSLI